MGGVSKLSPHLTGSAADSGARQPHGPSLGAVPPDIGAMDGELGARLSQLMAELAQGASLTATAAWTLLHCRYGWPSADTCACFVQCTASQPRIGQTTGNAHFSHRLRCAAVDAEGANGTAAPQAGSSRAANRDAARIADTLQQLAEQSRRHAGAEAPEMPPELASLLDPAFMAR